jgi:hypothetical protein
LAEAFSLYWLLSSPQQPHAPLDCILFKMISWSIGESGYLPSKSIVFEKIIECRSVTYVLAADLAEKFNFQSLIVVTQITQT